MDRLHAERTRAALRERLFGVASRPLELGRFEIHERLGAGAMGAVYAAWDPQLDRKVAVKLLHADGHGGADDLRRRLLREAKAIARLSHPNVVGIYDAGTSDGEVFVALEYVEGQTLRAWLRESPRGWRAIVDAFIQAGEGLAAAHGAGLVHRDFKPDNVLVGADGRVRVTDFGLARVLDAPVDASGSEKGAAASAPLALARTLSAAGAVVGTPRYMAPEQLAGEVADAQTDQFGFCAALFEALYDQPAFDGDDLAALRDAIEAGRVREPRGRRRVPGWLRRAVRRGLSPRPADRHPSMRALVSLLARGRARRGRQVAVGGVVLAAAVAGALVLGAGARESRVCRGHTAMLEDVWGQPHRGAVVAALTDAAPYGAAVARRVVGSLDAYAAAWADMYTEACEATRVHLAQSEEALDLRMGCLRDRLRHLGALAGVLASADELDLERATRASYELPDLHHCANLAALAAEAPPPEDPEVAAAVDDQAEILARARALSEAGRYPEGLALAADVAARAAELGHDPFEAEALLQLAIVQELDGAYEAAETSASEAFWKALGSKHDQVAAEAATLVVLVAGARLEQSDRAMTWARHAGGAVTRLGRGGLADARLAATVGEALHRQGRYDEARVELSRALELRERHLGRAHPAVAATLGVLGRVLEAQGRYDEAIAHQRRALSILEDVFGLDHPAIAGPQVAIGTLQSRSGAYGEARATYEGALEVYARTIGADHARAATLINNLGIVAWYEGDHDEALSRYQQALEVRRRALGDDHPEVAGSYNNIGLVLRALGRYDEAVEVYRQALAIQETAHGDRHPAVSNVLNNLGIALSEQGQYDEAEAAQTRALAIAEEAFGADSAQAGHALNSLGAVAFHRGDHRAALAYYRRALRAWEQAFGGDHPHVAGAHNNVGGALSELGAFGEAREHFGRSLAIFEGRSGPELRASADTLVSFGTMLSRQGAHGEALERHGRALAILEEALGPEHVELAYPLTGLGRAHLGLRQPREAVAPLERAARLRQGGPSDLVADTQFLLARALWDGGADRARAIALAAEAAASLEQAGRDAAELRAWLARRGG